MDRRRKEEDDRMEVEIETKKNEGKRLLIEVKDVAFSQRSSAGGVTDVILDIRCSLNSESQTFCFLI